MRREFGVSISMIGDPRGVSSFADEPFSAFHAWAAEAGSDGPPENVVPGIVPVMAVIGRTADTAIVLAGLAACEDGVTVTVEVLLRRGDPGEAELSPNRGWLHGAPVRVPLRVRFADGTEATGPDSPFGPPAPSFDRDATGPTPGVTLAFRGSSSIPGRTRLRYWLRPLPPPGPVTFTTSFAERDLAESTLTVDGALIRSAAEQAIELWPAGPALPADASPPADPAAARAAVQAAFTQAFTGGTGDPQAVLSAVQDGPSLLATLALLRARFPDSVRTARPIVEEVVFLGPDRAAVRFEIFYGSRSRSGRRIGHAVLDGGRWKVTRQTYCQVMSWAGVPCPPPG
ncbi:hypothetical protein FraQA3DRAFT_3563 [Frankia sp. QA3]|nr:hypothetical protein FraQA3DRAFT_3563 [Frankia sp. QA3]